MHIVQTPQESETCKAYQTYVRQSQGAGRVLVRGITVPVRSRNGANPFTVNRHSSKYGAAVIKNDHEKSWSFLF
jgi:hypothetical protein